MLNTRIGENYNANDVINSNDLRKRILNVDSRFRSQPSDSTTDFSFKLEHPYKNIIRLKVGSVEIPNMFYEFTEKNNAFILKAYDIADIPHTFNITIAPGNYTSAEVISAIQTQLDTVVKNPFGIFITVSLDTINAKVTFTHRGVATYPVTSPSATPTADAKPFVLEFVTYGPYKNKQRTTNFGLGYNLGFRSKAYRVTTIKPLITPVQYIITSEACLDVVGNTYMFLSINDLHTVEQKTTDNYLQCLAKIVIREDKYAVIYDDGGTLLSNEIIFPLPVDLSTLQVQLLDPYGEVVDLNGMNFSFSLEITEVMNTKMYDFYRNYIWLGTIPSVPYKTVQGSAQPLLRGIGPPF